MKIVTWIVSAVLAFILFLIIIVSSIFSSNVIQQNDFTLNQSWLHISQVDRQKSSDQVEYYTDIDSNENQKRELEKTANPFYQSLQKAKGETVQTASAKEEQSKKVNRPMKQ